MKILHIIPKAQLRGAEIFASQIAKIHEDQGHKLLFVALFDHNNQKKLEIPEIQIIELHANPSNRFLDFTAWKKLSNIIREFEADIVQANASDCLKYAVFSRKLFPWKSKLVYRNANKAGDFIDSKIKLMLNKWLVHQVDFVASVSRNCELDFHKTFNFPESKSSTLTIGTPIPEEKDRPNIKSVKSALGIPLDTHVIINIASLVPEKNHLGLLDIFESIKQTLPSVQLIIVGDGTMRNDLEKKIRTNEIKDVHLLGYRTDAMEILWASDLMLMPSFIEGMPGVILEAMARKKPVVASDVGGIGEVIESGISGFLHSPEEKDKMAKSTIHLLSDGQVLLQMGKRAYDFCVSNKSINKIADEFMEAYQSLAD